MNKLRIKITPLNLVVAVCFTYAIYCLLGFDTNKSWVSNTVKVLYTLALALILFLTDILFRRFIESAKWIWLIQGSFIILILVMMILFQRI
ncbi:hypothetical protein [Pedobacter cryophilus]|uniref:Uncharacterized protein n=1 Tax=Pedobacter cryophilus TaxID=2571271 RepID=A0A4U1BUF0_9SPHI|nr:hypothetical protein [Pedobacter cryophilus]TKB95518.1 hypothetical protein FA046_16080 [Pedobacter cryophilus]